MLSHPYMIPPAKTTMNVVLLVPHNGRITAKDSWWDVEHLPEVDDFVAAYDGITYRVVQRCWSHSKGLTTLTILGDPADSPLAEYMQAQHRDAATLPERMAELRARLDRRLENEREQRQGDDHQPSVW